MILKKWMILTFLGLVLMNNAYAQNEKSDTGVNIHVNPIMWLAGIYSIGLDVAVSSKVTLGGSYNHFKFTSSDFNNDDIDAKANGFGLRVQYFLNEAFQDGWYFTGFGDFSKGDVEDTVTSEFAKFNVNSMGATVGYFWRWTNFNIQLGLGLQNSTISVRDSTLSAQDKKDLEDLEGINPTGDFRIGLAF